MADTTRYLAIDMGAESSRAILGTLEGGALRLDEVHRWDTRHETLRDTQYWDFLYIFGEIKHAMRRCATEFSPDIKSVGADSWGVDFGLLDVNGDLLQNPVQYRDFRTEGLTDAAKAIIAHEDIYARTGIAFLPFNTLYQLWAIIRRDVRSLESADSFLMMPDLVHYHLCNVPACEFTNASTTQMLNVESRTWDETIVDAFGIPLHLLPQMTQPGTRLGALTESVARETKLPNTSVIAPCTHDTASAVLSIPAETDDWAYISCGTWSLMGAELGQPIATPEAKACNFTNEGGYQSTTRFHKNIMGLWVLQQARAAWEKRGATHTYAELAEQATMAKGLSVLFDIDRPEFFNPPDMLDAIAEHCHAIGGTPPDTVGATVRAILESLALKYALTLRELTRVTGRTFGRVHLVGGGARNAVLCQWASDAMGVPVLAGPAEGTALGNILCQAIACGDVADWSAARKMSAAIADIHVYEPRQHDVWRTIVDQAEHAIAGA